MSEAHLSLSPGDVMWWESELDHGSDLLSKSPVTWLSIEQSAFSPSAYAVFLQLHSLPHHSTRTKCCPTWQRTPSPGQCRGACQVEGWQLSLCFAQLGPLYHTERVLLYGLATQGGGDLSVPLWFSVELLAWCTYMANDDRERKDRVGILHRHAKYICTK